MRKLSCGVVVVRRLKDDWVFLLLRAYRFWDLPKGLLNANEEPLQAAIREVAEETTICDLQFKWGHVFKETEPYNKGTKVARFYIAETLTVKVSLPINPELGRAEHNAFLWADYQKSQKILSPRLQEIVSWARDIITCSN